MVGLALVAAVAMHAVHEVASTSSSVSVDGNARAASGVGGSFCSPEYLAGLWVGQTWPSRSSSGEMKSHHFEVSSLSYGTDANELQFRCQKSRKPGSVKPFVSCGWITANCTVYPPRDSSSESEGTLYCHFFNEVNGTETITEANATIYDHCSILAGWTHNFTESWSRIINHPKCDTYVQNTTCRPNPALNYSGCDCSTVDKCVDCAVQYQADTHGYYEAFYMCQDGLGQIRDSCGAWRSRESSPVITTKTGKIQGFIDKGSGHAVFRGIPYANPPVGDLRWRPPQPKDRWGGIMNTSTFGNTCAQRGPVWTSIGGVHNTSEDCLYLNVYAPIKYLPGSKKIPGPKPPTMIYFPAGQFLWGSGNDAENFIAPQTPAGREVIIVTANYRLGAAGFLALEEMRDRDPEGSIGNYGTLDQRAAMIWINHNIGAFGGDPHNVVLWGESAGSAAVTAHLAMPKSWPYFHKAIMESATFNGWSYKSADHAIANSMKISENLNCTYRELNSTTAQVNISCMLEAEIHRITLLDDDGAGIADGPDYGLPYSDKIDRSLWSVCIDGVNLVDTPANLLAAGKVARVPTLFGTNRDEGSTFTYNQTGTGYSDGPNFESFYDGYLFDLLQLNASSHDYLPLSDENFTTGLFVNESEFVVWGENFFGSGNYSNQLADMYRPFNPAANGAHISPVFNPEGITSWWWAMSRVIGDYALSCPARAAARLLEKIHLPAYVFHFNHTPVMSVNQKGTFMYGAFHGAEVPFVYYDSFELVDPSELRLSEAMVQYWTGFAWNGDPNIPPPNMEDGLEGLPEFPRYSTTEDRYIILGDTIPGGYPNITTLKGLKQVECDWWDTYMEKHLKPGY